MIRLTLKKNQNLLTDEEKNILENEIIQEMETAVCYECGKEIATVQLIPKAVNYYQKTGTRSFVGKRLKSDIIKNINGYCWDCAIKKKELEYDFQQDIEKRKQEVFESIKDEISKQHRAEILKNIESSYFREYGSDENLVKNIVSVKQHANGFRVEDGDGNIFNFEPGRYVYKIAPEKHSKTAAGNNGGNILNRKRR